MNDMTKTKQCFKITVVCPYCDCEMLLKSDTFIHENLVNVECGKCNKVFLAQNKFGGVGGVNE